MRYGILMEQMGRLGGSIIFMLRKIDGFVEPFDKAQMKPNLADAIQQLKMICEELDFDYVELSKLGVERYMERKAEFITKNKGELFI